MSRYELPDPKCMHKRTGIMTAGDPNTGPHAATNVCSRPECIEDAKAWVFASTHLEPEFIPDKKPDEQGSLL